MQATPWGTWGDESPLGGTWAGPVITASSSMQLLAVYGCVRFIVDGISTLPIHAYRDVGEKHVQIDTPSWLTQPTVDLDFIPWCSQVLSSLLLAGNAFLWKMNGPDGRLQYLLPLDPTRVVVGREAGRKTYRVNGNLVPTWQMVHVPGMMMPGSDIGISPVEYARQMIGSGLALEEFAARFFGQGMTMDGVIEDPGELSPERAKSMARTFARLHGGNRKAHLPGVLQGGAHWVPTGVTNEQAQFLASREFTAAEIASHMFLIDPSEFGYTGTRGSNLTYQNLEQRNARKVQVTFLPWLIRLENAFSMLIPQQPRYVKFDVSALLRSDTQTRYQIYQMAAQVNTQAAAVGMNPFLTTEEMREAEDLPPITTPPPPAIPSTDVPAAPGVKPLPTPPPAPALPAAQRNIWSPTINMPEIHVDVPAPVVNVEVPRQGPPIVNVDVEASPAPIVNVEAPPAAAAPEVHVHADAPIVNVEAPEVHVDVEAPKPKTKRVERNDAGEIIRVVEE